MKVRSRKSEVRTPILGSAICILSSPFCSANPRVVVANQSATFLNLAAVPRGFIVVPFAVPVAVPSYVQYQAVPSSGQWSVDSGQKSVASGQGSVASDADRSPSTDHRPPAADRWPLATVQWH